ncbi:hypothetical protein E2562_003464 [Oryza meyeriana var. granulata]|uniref:Uncharacterized protein n=1 Tax=Oryza meyeriana var. granulata TaxID=110450 RepID=A0A6G1CMU7_9ORYZ|nr:hypothetical protein E2562_003464 [Oryza meyeriana var. granulata]
MAVEPGGRRGAAARRKAKEAAVGAVARVLFYPTLLYNVVRSKVQAEFRWWDEVDQFLLFGADLAMCCICLLTDDYKKYLWFKISVRRMQKRNFLLSQATEQQHLQQGMWYW